jgi:hypothetical protein
MFRRRICTGLGRLNETVPDYKGLYALARGDAGYVDQGINTTIGSQAIGSNAIGGGGEVVAHPFEVKFPNHTYKSAP